VSPSQPDDVRTGVPRIDILETGPEAIEIVERGGGAPDDYYFDVSVQVPSKTHPAALAIALMRNLSVVSTLTDDVVLRFKSRDDGTRGNEAPILRLVFPDSGLSPTEVPVTASPSQPDDQHRIDVAETGPEAIEIVERGTPDDYYCDVSVHVPPKTHPAALAIALMRNLTVNSTLTDGVVLRFKSHDDVTRGNEAPILRLVFPDAEKE